MKLTQYFETRDEASAFASGLAQANTGHLHTIEVQLHSWSTLGPSYRVTWHDENRKPSELPEKHPPLTSAEYVERKGNLCPVCREDQLEGHSVDIDSGMAYQAISCLNPDCEASWVDCYELNGYDNLER